MNIEVGQIWIITDNGFTVQTKEKCNCLCGHIHDRAVTKELPKNTYIEIRYPFAWHFRTEKGEYYHALPELILDKCKFVGKIKDNIRFKNNHDLQEILDNNYFERGTEAEP